MNGNIPTAEMLTEQVFSIKNDKEFTSIALAVFYFQYHNNAVYRSYCNLLNKNPQNINGLIEIPFLPISFFKTHPVQATNFEPEVIFESSRTTGAMPSRHLVKNISVYRQSFLNAFELFYGNPQDYCFLGLLPSYLERENSSLVFMVADLIKKSGHPLSDFYLYDFESLAKTLATLEKEGQKTILIGVTHALLDFAAQNPIALKHTIVMETGGMKGRKKEQVRSEVHQILKEAFQMKSIHSEYGMTELLSQAYATGDGLFFTPPWMKILLRAEDDPLSIINSEQVKSGAINVIDLANIFSCSFIATEDVGKLGKDGSFEILGRLDNSEIRGCSLMVL